MFHAFDNDGPNRPTLRPTWMALLARAPLPLLEQYLAPHLSNQSQWLRRPETGLMMVQGRAGGTGERFNLGEITVTRCTLRLGDAAGNTPVGVAYVLGRSDYLRASWHAHTRPASLALDPDVRWLGLEVKSHRQVGEDRAEVVFVARYRLAGQAVRLHERSRFVREDGRWFYLDGDSRR